MSEATALPNSQPALRVKFPPQVKYIVGNETCERFSFYGMRVLLVGYMATHLGFSTTDSESKYHLFMSAVYFTPLVGGWLSDRFFGRYQTILWVSLLYVAGHALLAFEAGKWGFYGGLGLIALGAGGIKPCVSAFVGDQFGKGQERLLERVYGIFYMGINSGSTIALMLTPWIMAKYGPWAAFGLPGVLMAIALVLYVGGRKHYVKLPPTGPNPHGFVRVTISRLRGRADDHPTEAVDGAKAVVRILGLFVLVIAFWALYDQQASTWTVQAGRMNLHVLGVTLEAEQVQTLNAVLILIMIPFLSWGPYRWLEKRGYNVSALSRMRVGMFVMAGAFAAAALVEAALVRGVQLNVAWQLPQYLLLSLAEVLVSATGLEFAFAQAPKTMKSTIMSFWFLAISLGNLVTAYVANVNVFHGATFFWFFAGLMGAAALAFAFVASRYRVAAAPAAEPIAA